MIEWNGPASVNKFRLDDITGFTSNGLPVLTAFSTTSCEELRLEGFD